MAIKTKSMADIAEKWVRKAQGAGQDYAAGVRNPKTDWQAATSAASGNYDAGVQAAIGRGAFAKGVANAGTQKWQNKAISKGVPRYPTGVTAGKDDFSKGFTPFLSVIQGVDLPPRGPKGDPGNYARVSANGQALHNAKVGS